MNAPDRRAIVAPMEDCPKQFATIAAQLALRGFSLYRLDHGGYLIARWDRTAHAPDLRGAAQFLERLG